MPEPTLEEIVVALDHPYQESLTPPFAAAYLLVRGCDGPALRELAGLADDEHQLAFELAPLAAAEAAEVLEPVRRQLWPEDDEDAGEPAPAVVVAYSAELTSAQVDELAEFIGRLSQAVESAGLGDVDGPVDEADELVVLCYGDDVDELLQLVRREVQGSPVPPLRVDVRR